MKTLEGVKLLLIQEEISNNRQNIRTDGYSLSISEIVNLYRDDEIRIRPEFQRLFRWPIEKQSRLIESILLDIPLPSIFVAQAPDGVWEVVDGLQRISTILKFMGELRCEDDQSRKVDPERLTRTKYIPSLDGISYSDLPKDVQLQFKRSRVDVRILLRESDDTVKFELFDRLNSGGVPTSAQEVRSAILLMKNAYLFKILQELRTEDAVNETLALTSRQIDEQFDLELLVRLLVFKDSSPEELAGFSDIDTFLSDGIFDIANASDADLDEEISLISRVFTVAGRFGYGAFRKFNKQRGASMGGFSVSSFEAVTAGILHSLEAWEALAEEEFQEKFAECIANLWDDFEFKNFTKAGTRATTRAPRMPSIGARVFDLS